MNWIHSRWATEILLIAQKVKLRLSFYFLKSLWRYYELFQVLKMVQDKMMQLNVTADLKKKMKTYADAKWRTKPTESKAGDDVLIKYTGTRDKLTSYWANDLFTVVNANGHVIIVKRKKDWKVFARNTSMVKKYKHISWFIWPFRHR